MKSIVLSFPAGFVIFETRIRIPRDKLNTSGWKRLETPNLVNKPQNLVLKKSHQWVNPFEGETNGMVFDVFLFVCNTKRKCLVISGCF